MKLFRTTGFGRSAISLGRRISAALLLSSALVSTSHADSISLGGPLSPSFTDVYTFSLSALSNDLTYFTGRTSFAPFLGFGSFTATLFSGSTPLISGADGPTAFFSTPNSFFLASVGPGTYHLDISGSTVPFVSGGYSGILSSTGPIALVPEPEVWAMMLVGVGLVGMRLRRKSRLDGAGRFA